MEIVFAQSYDFYVETFVRSALACSFTRFFVIEIASAVLAGGPKECSLFTRPEIFGTMRKISDLDPDHRFCIGFPLKSDILGKNKKSVVKKNRKSIFAKSL